MASRILLRGDTAANWTSVNPILAAREEGIETDTKRRKIGDGTTAWNALPYATVTPGDLNDPTSAASVSLRAAFGALSKVAATATAAGALVVNKHNPVDASGGTKAMTLPTGQTEGTQISVEKADSSTNTVTVTGSIRGVDGTTETLVGQYEDLVFVADSAGSWWVRSGHKTKAWLSATFAQANVSRNTLVLDGDSLTALGEDDATDPTSPQGASFGLLARGPWNWALTLLGQRLNLIGNASVSGQTSSQLVARFAANVAPLRPGYYAVTIGTNDITQDVPLATLQANVLWIISQCRAMGTTVILNTIPPHGGDAGTVPARRLTRVTYNNWLQSLRGTVPDLIVLDSMPRVTNPSTGEYVTGYSWDTPNVHYALQGAQAVGQYIADTLAPLLPAASPLPSSPLDPENLLPNPFMIGNTAGLANSTVVGDTGSSTHTVSKVTRTDGIQGEWQRVVNTAVGTGSGVRCYQVLNPVTSVIGRRLRAWAEFQCPVADWSTITHFRLNLTAYTTDFSSQVSWFGLSVNSADTWLPGYKPGSGVLTTPTKGLLIPVWAQRVDVRVEFKGLGTFDVGRMKLAVVG